MTTMIVKTEGVISNPTGTPALVGKILTSDSFSLNSTELAGTMTNAKLGGLSFPWIALAPWDDWGLWQPTGDGLILGIEKANNFGAYIVDKSMNRVAVSFKLRHIDATLQEALSRHGDAVFVEIKRNKDIPQEAYRLSIRKDTVMLMYRDSQGFYYYLAETPYNIGDDIMVVLTESAARIYINGETKANVVNTFPMWSGYAGFGRGAILEDMPGEVKFGDFIIYSLD